jgi:hypothetical protein
MTSVGEPALADEATAQRYALSVRQARAWVLGHVLNLVFLVVVFLWRDLFPSRWE